MSRTPEISARYKASQKGKANARRYAQSEKGKRSAHNARLRSVYGITLDDYDTMFDAQDGGCAICHVEGWTQPYGLVVDHDHETQEVRGLLCDACNTGLGKFKDSPEVLSAAAEYLEKRRG